MGKVRLLVELDVKADEADAFEAMFKDEFIVRSRKEQGCEQYELWRGIERPNKMTIIEIWSSQADLDRHMQQEWFQKWGPKMHEAQETPLVVRKLISAEDTA
jgi:quinol monooxygenase YgiN